MTTKVTTYDQAQDALAAALPYYEKRDPQDTLAHAIEAHLARTAPHKDLLAEAGTGTGKSLAYLIPAILSGKRVIVSTATKALQDQIANTDLPLLEEHLGVPFTWAILKGRSNYLCRAQWNGRVAQENPDLMRRVKTVVDAHANDENFFAEREEFILEAREWAQLTISSQDCPGKKSCPFGETCFSEAAKARAQQANVVVVNHALLLLDLWLRETTGGAAQVLGDYDAVVIDECHELEEWATSTWEQTFKAQSLVGLGADIRSFCLRRTGSAKTLGERVVRVLPEFTDAVNVLFEKLPEDVRLVANDIVAIGEEIVRAVELLEEIDTTLAAVPVDGADRKGLGQKNTLLSRVRNAKSGLTGLVTASFEDVVRWVDTDVYGKDRIKTKVLHSAPINVAPVLDELLFSQDGVVSILVSATVTVDGKFDYIAGRVGLSDYAGLDVGTPFDYQKQAVLYIPDHLPEPSGKTASEWQSRSVAEIADLVKHSRGRALILFTSKSQMQRAYDALAPRLPYTCLVQGAQSNKELAAAFMSDESSVLFATKSFFTGVNFRGSACSLVVIDKLTFDVPTTPVFAARCEAVERAGGNAFSGYSVPKMALVLKQGFGRLIRHSTDVGVVAILDRRVTSKGYGKQIVRSLPDCPLVREPGAVEAFYASH
jgi:ATP-dependent DNA helicase DinG